MQKNKNLIISIVLLIFVIAFGYIIVNTKLGKNKTEQIGLNVAENSEWKTYENWSYGFKFDYDSSYNLTEEYNEDNGRGEPPLVHLDLSKENGVSNEPGSFTLTVNSLEYDSIDKILKVLKENYSGLVVSKKNINGVDFTLVSFDISEGLHVAGAYVEYNHFIYIFSFSPDAENFLNTFKFTTEKRNSDFSNWKTYRDKDYGFEIKYPNGYVVWESELPKDGHILRTLIVYSKEDYDMWVVGKALGDGPSNYLWIIVYPNGDKLTEVEWAKKHEPDSMIGQSDDYIFKDFAGKSAIHYVRDGLNPFYITVFANNNLVFLANVSTRNSYFNDILSTFKFTK